jgi:hypothetical protein
MWFRKVFEADIISVMHMVKVSSERYNVQFRRWAARGIKGGGRFMGFELEPVRYDYQKRKDNSYKRYFRRVR